MTKFDQQLKGKFGGHFHPSTNLNLRTTFTIKHYAGDVDYKADDFLDKNADSMFNDLIDTMNSSGAALPKALFEDGRTAEERAKRPPSVSVQFKGQVNELMAALHACNPNYIRCIKPNDEKKPGLAVEDRIDHQVTYLGLVENVRVRRAGFAFRMEYGAFAERFKMTSAATWPVVPGDARAASVAIVSAVDPAPRLKHVEGAAPPPLEETTGYVLGKTKIFIKEPRAIFALEGRRNACLARMVSHFLSGPARMKRAKNYLAFCKAKATRLAARARSRLAVKAKEKAYAANQLMQSQARSYLDYKVVKGMKKQFRGKPPRYWANKIARVARGYATRGLLDKALVDKCKAAMRRVRDHAYARVLQPMVRSFVACKRLAARERSDFDATKALLDSEAGIPVVRHVKGSLLKPSHGEDDTLSIVDGSLATKARSMFNSEKHLVPLGDVTAITKGWAGSTIFPKSKDANAQTDVPKSIFIPAKRVKDGKVVHENELAVVLGTKKLADSVFRTLYIVKHGAAVVSWRMVHARPSKIKRVGDKFVVEPAAW